MPQTVRARVLAALVAAVLAGGAVVLPAASATAAPVPVVPVGPYAAAWWVGDELRIVYDAVGPFTASASDAEVRVLLDGRVVDSTEDVGFHDRVVVLPRDASAGAAHVQVESVALIELGSYYDERPTVHFDETVERRTFTPEPGQVADTALLDGLRVATETRSGSYRAARFGPSVDSGRPGGTTRDRVLRAESQVAVVRDRRGAVRSGRWHSVYDGRTVTRASSLAVDHLVPLRDAWSSGAASWSARKRVAFANDADFAPALLTATVRSVRDRAGRDPGAWRPADRSPCFFFRDWIAVKHRWGLSVDPAEKTALRAGLLRFCVDPSMPAPPAPDVAGLARRAAQAR